ncbi:MAG: ABC transporter permease [Gemmatimonadetes bacterium]|nr:ABC transporter permease [Gemmatimonadota bacterium]
MTRPRLVPRDIAILYVRELRAALRERTMVMNSILLPIVLYPFILWVTITGISFVQGLTQGFVSRVVVTGLPPEHAELRDTLDALESVELRDEPADAVEAVEAVRARELDAVLEFLPADVAGSALSGNFRVRVSFDRSEARSRAARERVEAAIERYRDRWLEWEAGGLGLTPEELEQFRVASRNVASEREMGAMLLGTIIPLFLVVMVALGCFVPAVDATAGERERRTWETTLTLAASRASVVTAKYLHVATLGALAGILNAVAVTVALGPIFRPLMAGGSEAFEFRIPVSAVPIMVLGSALLALFFAAAMMILAAFARTFKEGQSMVTPVYWLAIIPIVLGESPDNRLTAGIALVPVANVAMMIRDAIVGRFAWPLIGLTLLVGLGLVAVCLWSARWVLQFEDLLLGSYDGSFWKFLRDRSPVVGRRSRQALGRPAA